MMIIRKLYCYDLCSLQGMLKDAAVGLEAADVLGGNDFLEVIRQVHVSDPNK